MLKQIDIFNQSQEKRDEGIRVAVDHADSEIKNWSNLAKKAADAFISHQIPGNRFQVEDVRQWAYLWEIVPHPPSERAWACIVRYLLKQGKIRAAGYAPVQNIKANATPASVWEVV